MRNILVLQHVAHEILGTLNPLLKQHGLRIRYVNFHRDPNAQPSLDGYNGLIILGGPMGVYEQDKHPHLKIELKLIEEALKKNIPVLGICLGAQMLAHVLKADVKKGEHKELGWHDVHLKECASKDPLFEHFKSTEKIFQLHGDFFEIPKSTEHLAFSKIFDGQAFRYGQKAYGMQFHLEVDAAMVNRWLNVRAIKEDIDSTHGLVTNEKIQADTALFIERSLSLSEKTFLEFIKLFELPERPEVLDSGHGKPKGKIGL
jgi:GMP synthase (glutamine-hydrolysing)